MVSQQGHTQHNTCIQGTCVCVCVLDVEVFNSAEIIGETGVK